MKLSRLKGREIRKAGRCNVFSALAKEKETQAIEAQKSHAEAFARIAELEKVVDDQQNQNNTLEMLSQELGGACKWLLTHDVPLLADRLVA
ncbi:hypothetical protein Hdeb2414_s0015g00440231 [Helianthus debilis subsp. tardiflorus]